MKSNEEINSDIDNLQNAESNSNNTQEEHSLPDASIEQNDVVSKMEAELTESRDKYLRLYSDFENYKKRVSRDRVEQSKMAGSEIFLAFLPIMDDLDRALKSVEDAKDSEPIKEGLRLIYSKMKSSTESKGLKSMDAKGLDFNADLHDAIANVPAPEEKLKGKVLDEVEKGYYLNDKVIRHAKVIVGV